MARSWPAPGLALLAVVAAGSSTGCRRESVRPSTAGEPASAPPERPIPDWVRSAEQNRAATALAAPSGASLPGFEQNAGQFAGDAKFIARTALGVFLLRPNGLTSVVAPPESLDDSWAPPPAAARPRSGAQQARSVDFRWMGARPDSVLKPMVLLPQSTGYFAGDPKSWLPALPSYQRVAYPQLYPEIDLNVYLQRGEVKYDFVVAPGGSVASIQLEVEGADGVEISRDGDLVVRVAGAELRHTRPVIYQLAGGTRRKVEGGFVQRGGTIGFRVGEYDPRLPLVIDPTIVQRYSTVLTGGIGHAQALAVAVAPDGDVFATGWANVFTSATAFTKDAFVGWYDGQTGFLKHASFFGGKKTGCSICDASDIGTAIAVDGNGAVYLTGSTQSIGFPVTANAFDPDCGDDKLCGRGTSLLNPVKTDAFVLKLNRSGSSLGITWGTYLGGGVDDAGTGIAVDAAGTIYVAGFTHSGTFPVKNAFQSNWNGGNDAFLTALAPGAANQLVFSTYFGSSGEEFGTALALDPVRNLLYLAGSVTAPFANPPFPATDPIGPPASSGGSDAFLAQFTTAGAFIKGTFLRGSGNDRATGVAVDAAGSVYVSGTSDSSNLIGAGGPTAGGSDAFVAKLHFIRRKRFVFAVLDYLTLLGGSDEDTGNAIAVDAQGRAHVAGMTRSTNFPTAGQPQPPLRSTKLSGQTCGTQQLSCPDAFVARLNSAGAIDYVALFGDQSFDEGMGVALRHTGDVVVASESFNFGAAIPHWEAVVTRVISGADLAVSKSCTPTPAHTGHPLTCTFAITNNGPEPLGSATVVDTPNPPTWYDALTLSGSPCSTFTDAQGRVAKVTCPVANLAANATRNITYPFIPAKQGTLLDHLQIAFADDWNGANDGFDLSIPVQADADLSAFKYHLPEPTPLLSETSYHLWVGNQGNDLADDVQVQDSIPAGLEVLSVTPGAGSCSPTQGIGPLTITCKAGPLVQPQGLSGIRAVDVQFQARAATAGSFANTATVSGPVTDPVPANDTFTDTLQVIVGTPKITVFAQAVSRAPAPGGLNVTLEMEFRNAGDGNAVTVRTTQVDAVNVAGTGTVTRVGGLPADIPLLGPNRAKSRLPVFLVAPGATRFDAVFQGDYEDASGSGTKIPFGGKVTIVP